VEVTSLKTEGLRLDAGFPTGLFQSLGTHDLSEVVLKGGDEASLRCHLIVVTYSEAPNVVEVGSAPEGLGPLVLMHPTTDPLIEKAEMQVGSSIEATSDGLPFCWINRLSLEVHSYGGSNNWVDMGDQSV
jgi:hypothetical protein